MRRITCWLGAALAAALVACGCAGVLTEKINEEGKMERIRLDTGYKWSSLDKSGAKEDDKSLLLKKEIAF